MLMDKYMVHLFKFAILSLMLLVGCSDGGGGVKSAKGDTPVKYVICSSGEQNCFVSARFTDLNSCESHKDWAEMLCDKKSNPGNMTCTIDTLPKVAFSYCSH